MTTSTHPIHVINYAAPSTFNSWVKNGFLLFLKAPFKLFFFLLSALIVEGLFQVIPSSLSIPISKIAIILFTAAVWPILAHLSETHKFRLNQVLQSKGWIQALLVSPLFLLPFVCQLLTAYLLLGQQGISLLLFGEMMDINHIILGFIFAAGAPVMVGLSFVMPRILLNGEQASNALINGLKMVVTAWKPMSLVLFSNILILLFVPISFALSALLLGPLLLCINYVAYHQIMNADKD